MAQHPVPDPKRPRASAAKRARTPGRPTGESPDLRARLLDAAIGCYVHRGIAATSLRAIALEAGVTPALLHYYFGDKQQLLEAVIEERLMPALESLREPLLRAGDDVAALVVAFVRGVGEVVAKHPWLPSLWVREILSEGGALRELLVNRIAPQVPQMLAQRFAKAQREGSINPDLDPRLLVVSLVGLTLFPAAGAPIWRRIFDADDLDAAALREHTIALLDRGIGGR
ncbi:TetR/AcrR family transcriptional regulator [Lysobacter koreensis]|uniref:TetR/AcrR family transcriptional regulator n=1 Tax=Lysobacter koreensis TaxID=266122 RepID=A0ABW2YM37_9GAMM